ncbi:hypothetical protein F2Q69_00009090 [Brassica cretica]|uniref:Uncharacterized protein n=1 Tax=Brassica cretica TaxID=69181 RepID=A0A8S9PGY1_BRACR|nr:hypothetical protein F2Q69_00009090 [Brassica cretica]
MANPLSDEPTTNSIMPKFEVWEFCDNLVEGVVKALKDVSKIQKKSTTTRAPVAKPSLFINEKPKGKSENNLEDVKDFSDSLPIFDEYDEDLIENLMICEDNCDLTFPELDFVFDKEQTIAELTFLQLEHPSSLVLFSQDFQEKKAPSITPIIMENNLCFDPGTTPTPFPINFQEHFKFLKHNQAVQTGYLRDASDKGSVQGEYLNIQKVFCHESNFLRRPTQQVFTESWNYNKIFTEEEVMNFTNRMFPRPSICEYQIFEGDSSPMMKRPEPKPIIGLKMDLPAFHKPNIRRNVHLNTQVSWTDTILDELSKTDTHLDKLSKQVRSSELVRPPEKLEMANLLSDERPIQSCQM